MNLFLWYAFVSIIFLFGGALQYVGLLTPTETNFVLIALGSLLVVANARSLGFGFLCLFFSVLFVLIIGYFNGSSSRSVVVYIYYVVCCFVALCLGRAFYRKSPSSVHQKALLFFMVAQAVVTTIQSVVVGRYSEGAQESDLVSGTLFLNSDATLVACMSLFVIFVFAKAGSLFDKLLVILVALAVVTNCSSKAGELVFYIVAICLLASLFVIRLPRQLLFFFIGGSLLSALMFYFVDAYELVISFIYRAIDGYNFVEYGERASRFAPIGQFFSEGVTLYGDGYLTYYDPVNKSWLYDSGLGTYYSLIIDAGVVAAAFCFVFFLWLALRIKNRLYAILVFLIFFSYSFFNFGLSDMAFMFAYSFVTVGLYENT